MGLVLEILNGIRSAIAADDGALQEARIRRDLVAEGGLGIEGSLRWFRSGSLAHATVNAPVDDADAGLVLDRRTHNTLGPDADGESDGPGEIVDTVIELVRSTVRNDYPLAVVSRSRRGVLVEFHAPLADGQDPSVDLIVTLTRRDLDGLWIPDLYADDWSASHPEKHTALFTAGTTELRRARARVTRLAKAWNKQWAAGNRALSSFNVEALAWEFVEDASLTLDEALAGWFRYARDAIEAGDTEDPAGVSEPIKLMRPRDEVVMRLGFAAEQLESALANEGDEDAVREALGSVFYEYVDAPVSSKAALASSLRRGNAGLRATGAGLALTGGSALKTTRAYGRRPTNG